MKNISGAILQAQKRIKNAAKDAKNPHFKNDYATLESVIEAVKDVANDCGIAIVQSFDGKNVLTRLIHAGSGEELTSSLELVLDKQNMQGYGSAATYARRYSLAAMFCITQVDDDGNLGSGINTKQEVTFDNYKPEKVGTNNGNRSKNEL